MQPEKKKKVNGIKRVDFCLGYPKPRIMQPRLVQPRTLRAVFLRQCLPCTSDSWTVCHHFRNHLQRHINIIHPEEQKSQKPQVLESWRVTSNLANSSLCDVSQVTTLVGVWRLNSLPRPHRLVSCSYLCRPRNTTRYYWIQEKPPPFRSS